MAALVVALAAGASTAGAQSREINGLLTGHLGRAAGGDIADGAAAPGASIAVMEGSGWGAEIDFGYVPDFEARFADSSIVTGMVNVIGMVQHPRYRPFGVGGLGGMRVRASVFEGVPAVSRTALAFNGGGGLLVIFNDTIGVRGDLRYFSFFESYADLPAAGRLDFWRLSIGATYSWPIR